MFSVNDFRPGAVNCQKALRFVPLTTQNVLKRTGPAGRGVFNQNVWLAVQKVTLSSVFTAPGISF